MNQRSAAQLIVEPSPHVTAGNSVRGMMRDVLIALVPAGAGALLFFGWRSGLVIAVCGAAAVLAEHLCNLLRRRQSTVGDLSALVTGVLLAFTLPAGIPLWMAALGAAVGVVFAKQLFGGLGFNIWNPALVGRAFLQISFQQQLSRFAVDGVGSASVNGVSGATPLGILKHFPEQAAAIPPLPVLAFGWHWSSLGESSEVLLVLGFLYLMARRQVMPLIPLTFIGTVAAVTAVVAPAHLGVYLLSGGLFLGALYMATDPVTSPVSPRGKLLFGVGCGLLTALIRFWGAYPEGVCFSILIMNTMVPLIDRVTVRRPFGVGRRAS